MKLNTLVAGRGVMETNAKPEFDSTFDMVVAGLGSAGAIAVIAGARRGLSVLGIDKLCLMGGSGTAGGIASYYYGVSGGIFEEIDVHAKKIAGECFPPADGFHPEARHLALEEASLRAGARLAYTSRIIGVFRENARVCGIRWISPAGMRDTACRMLIDATGDGEVCAIAGCEFIHGREFDGVLQPYSHVPCWIINGRHVYQNFDAGSTVSAVDGKAFSDGIVRGGAMHLRDRYSETEKLLYCGRLPGLREGRLIKGEKTLRLAEYLAGEKTDQPVFYEFANLDTHTCDWAFESDAVQEWLTVASLWGQTFSVPVPLETMIPMGMEGLMTAGRCLAVDHDLAQALRMQRAMQQCGEAVATAAALALRKNVSVRALSYEELAVELRQTGCLPVSVPPTVTQQLPGDSDGIRAGLASDKPGLAIWAARLRGEEVRLLLHECLKGTDADLSRNAALALGLLNDTAALPVLREIISTRDPYVPKSGPARNARRLCAALYLCGRMGDEAIVKNALCLLTDAEKDFDVFSHAFAALLRIGRKNKKTRAAISNVLREILEASGFRISLPNFRSRLHEPSENYFRIAAALEIDRWQIRHKLLERLDVSQLTARESGLYRKFGLDGRLYP